jgi:hypothetical protein
MLLHDMKNEIAQGILNFVTAVESMPAPLTLGLAP